MPKNNPFGPWGNPKLEEGVYEAVVQNVQHIDFGEGEGSMLELTFRLQISGLCFVSRLYFPATFSSRCQHRFWYLCQALEIQGHDLMEDPNLAVGRRMILEVATIHPTMANRGHPYSDVRRFLPPSENQQECADSQMNVDH